MSKLNKVSIAIGISGSVLAMLLIYLLEERDRTLINKLSILGTIASLVG
ncbi:hypothetical protein [Arcicella rigui]|uniref:Uncharacterized protein n=1 Tax=Arcicella rigui TaxID=797020 RepID=A0ABU5QB14_9BACT|nr:hypothetical protein [Arcicella rigui]MEA5139798.1 hypothetical protein [Arcicella rigui]